VNTLPALTLPNTNGAFSAVMDLSGLTALAEITFAVPGAGSGDSFQVYFTTNPGATTSASGVQGPLLTGPAPGVWPPQIPARYLIVQRIAGTTTGLTMQTSGQETPGMGGSGPAPSTGTFSAVANLATGGAIGTAPATVDNFAFFTVNQTTAGQSVTLPAPTQTTPARLAYVENTGTQAFQLYTTELQPGFGAVVGWNGTAWNLVGVGNAISQGLNFFGAPILLGTGDANKLGLYTNAVLALLIDAAQNVGIGQATPKAKLDLAGALLLEPVAIANLATGGSVGSAATTVDVGSVLEINQTTAGQALTLPPPTNNTAHGRYLVTVNVGTVSFLIGDATLAQNLNLNPGAAASKGQGCVWEWDGTAWVPISAFLATPAQGANLGDANVTVTRAGQFSQYTLPAGTLSTGRTVTLPSSAQGALPGDVALVSRVDATANTLTVANGGGGGGNLIVMPASKINFVMAWFNGVNWIYMSGGAQ
jgi:hypothetical protein